MAFPERTSTYRFFQFWINSDDRDVEKLLKLFTFLPLEEILGIMDDHSRNPEKRGAQRRLAIEVTSRLHGAEAASAAERASGILFGERFEPSDLTPEMLKILMAEVPAGSFPESAIPSAVDILAASGACSSKSEARRLIQGGGVNLNGRRLSADDQILTTDLLKAGIYSSGLGKNVSLLQQRRSHNHVSPVRHPRSC